MSLYLESEAQKAPPAAKTYPALETMLEQAELRIQAAADDDTWIRHFMIWMELHRLKWQELKPYDSI